MLKIIFAHGQSCRWLPDVLLIHPVQVGMYVGFEKQVVGNFQFRNLLYAHNFTFATVLTWLLLPANWQKWQF